MKKYFILLIALFLVKGAMGQGSLPALSVDAYTKSRHPEYSSQHGTISSLNSIRGNTINRKWEASDHRNTQRRSLIQIYDSIYFWVLDTTTMEWQISERIADIVYDDRNNLTVEEWQEWNGSAWVNYLFITFSYDVNNNQTSQSYQRWQSNALENLWLITYSYDASNMLISELNQMGNGSTWNNFELITYTYDASYNLTSELWLAWTGSAWENQFLYTNTYDTNNNKSSASVKEWHDNAWENKWQLTWTYDTGNNLIVELSQTWNGSAWENDRKYTHTYDINKNRISLLLQDWWGGNWYNSSLYTYTYGASNNLLSELMKDWVNNAFVKHSLRSNTYDANNFTVSDSYKRWNQEGTVLVFGDSTHYYFHTLMGMKDLPVPMENLAVYPNPSSSFITIELPHPTALKNTLLIIYNISGRQLITRQITELRTQIDISTLPGDVYFMRLTGERSVLVGKFVKQQ